MSSPRLSLIVIGLWGAALVARAEDSDAAPASDRPSGAYRDSLLVATLENGLQVVIDEDHSKPLVSVRAIVKVGGMDEDEFLGCGLSHYMEHIVSGGTTDKRSEKESQEILKGIGKMTNASTWVNWTQYYITTGSENTETALDLIGDWLAHCRFTEQEVAREQKVVQEELLRNKDNPGRELFSAWMQTRYIAHPARVPVIGYQENIDRLTRDDMFAFYKRWYAPNNTVLAIVGDVDKSRTMAWVEQHFGAWRRKPVKPVIHESEPAQTSMRWVEREFGPTRQTLVRMGVPAPILTDPDLYPLDLMAFILGEGRSSRLAQKLMFAVEGPRVQSVSASSWTPTWGPGAFSVDFTVPDHAEAANLVWEVWDELRRFADAPVSAEELERAKKMKVREFYKGRQTFDDRSSSLGHNLAEIGDPLFDERYVENIQKVSAEAIQAAAKKHFDRDKLTVVMIKPRPGVRADDIAAPPITDGHEQSGPRVRTLDNGARIMIKPTTGTGSAAISLRFRAGLAWESDADNGLTNLMASSLLYGSKNHPFPQIFAELDDKGCTLSPVSKNDMVGLDGWCLAEDSGWLLELIADLCQNASFDEAQFENGKKRLTGSIKQALADGDLQAALAMKHQLFQKHPYKRWRLGNETLIQGFTRDQVIAQYRKFFTGGNMTLVIVGDVDAEATFEKVKALFTPLAGEKPAAPAIEAEPALEPSRTWAANDQIRINYYLSFPGVDRNHPDFFALEVIDSVISGMYYPSGWLHEGLRGGDANLVYSVHALNYAGDGAGYFYIVTDFQPQNFRPVHGIINSVMDRITGTMVDAAELERAKAEAITSFSLRRQDNAADAAGIAEDEAMGLGWDWERRYAEGIRHVNAEQTLAAAKKYLSVRTYSVIHPKDHELSAEDWRGADDSSSEPASAPPGEKPDENRAPSSPPDQGGTGGSGSGVGAGASRSPDLVLRIEAQGDQTRIIIGETTFSDRDAAIAHLAALEKPPAHVHLVHGDDPASMIAAAHICEALVDKRVTWITRESAGK